MSIKMAKFNLVMESSKSPGKGHRISKAQKSTDTNFEI